MDAEVLSLAEVRHLLVKEQDVRAERGGDLRLEQKLALQHAELFSRLKVTRAKKLRKALLAHDVSPEQASKVVDFLPRTLKELDPIFSKDRTPPEKDFLKGILELVEEHAPEDVVEELPEVRPELSKPGETGDGEDEDAEEGADGDQADEADDDGEDAEADEAEADDDSEE